MSAIKKPESNKYWREYRATGTLVHVKRGLYRWCSTKKTTRVPKPSPPVTGKQPLVQDNSISTRTETAGLYTQAPSSTTHNSQKAEATQASISGCMDKTEHGVPTQALKARKLHACSNRDEPQYTVSETSQSQKDETMLCDSPHTRHLKQSNSLKTESRMVVARSWREEEMRAVV